MVIVPLVDVRCVKTRGFHPVKAHTSWYSVIPISSTPQYSPHSAFNCGFSGAEQPIKRKPIATMHTCRMNLFLSRLADHVVSAKTTLKHDVPMLTERTQWLGVPTRAAAPANGAGRGLTPALVISVLSLPALPIASPGLPARAICWPLSFSIAVYHRLCCTCFCRRNTPSCGIQLIFFLLIAPKHFLTSCLRIKACISRCCLNWKKHKSAVCKYNIGSYSVFCWYGPRPMAPRIMAAELAV